MNISVPYMQIKGHSVDLNPNIHQVYSDEFKHVIIHYYVLARTDSRYRDIRVTVAGKVFLKALFSRDIVLHWTLFGGTFIFSSKDGIIPISNQRAIELLVDRFLHQRILPNWELGGYGYLRRVIFAKLCCDSKVSSDGKEIVNEETPLFPPTLYVESDNRHHSPKDPESSRKYYNRKRCTVDKRKFSRRNNQYVNGALYDKIPSTCGQIIPDLKQNSRIILKVKSDLNQWSQIVITKFHPSRLKKINTLTSRFHEAFQVANSGEFNVSWFVEIIKFLLSKLFAYL